MRADEPIGKALYELFSSMRFAITLLTLLAVASIIGTVLKQAEPYNNYIIQFGPYWFEVFRLLGLYDVYHASWFLVILAFLVGSTSLCIYRNAPGMLKEMRNFRENVTEQSLAAFSHKHEIAHERDEQTLANRMAAYLQQQGFRTRIHPREYGVLIAAKRGAASRLGYLLAHSAIVLICIGGLIDGNLVFKAQQLLGMKKIETRDIPQSQVPAISRLSPDNLSFRGSVQIPEGGSADVVFLNVADGYLVQGYSQIDPITQQIITTGEAGNITVPPGVLRQPVATTQFSTRTNLDSDAVQNTQFTSSIKIYDALGSSHVLTITYTKDAAPGAWTYEITVPGEEISGGTPGTPQPIFTGGTVQFDATGKLQTLNGGAPADVAITTAAWANGAAASTLTWSILDTSGTALLSGVQSASATSSINQNGSAAGKITDISIDSAGKIIATFGAGQTIAVGQLALAQFNNPKGLVKLGSNKYGESQAAGVANIGIAGTGGRGTLIGSAIEQSNVDIATEFTQMILAQRGYQANAKTITVSDEILVDTLQLKR